MKSGPIDSAFYITGLGLISAGFDEQKRQIGRSPSTHNPPSSFMSEKILKTFLQLGLNPKSH